MSSTALIAAVIAATVLTAATTVGVGLYLTPSTPTVYVNPPVSDGPQIDPTNTARVE
jgi:hypothetical protein